MPPSENTIRELVEEGVTHEAIATRFGLTPKRVSQILCGHTHSKGYTAAIQRKLRTRSKVCVQCGQRKALADFYAHMRGGDPMDRQARCKLCDNEGRLLRTRAELSALGVSQRVTAEGDQPKPEDVEEEPEESVEQDDPERSFRILAWRAYERAGARAVDGTGATWAHRVDDMEIARWVNVYWACRQEGLSPQQAHAAANDDELLGPPLGKEDPPVGYMAPERGGRGPKPLEGVTDRYVGPRLVPDPPPADDVEALAPDVAGLKPELGAVVPERRLGARKLEKVRRSDAEAEARDRARHMAREWEAPPLDREVLAALAAGGARSAYDLAVILPSEPSPFDVRASLVRLEKAGKVENCGRGRAAQWRATR